MYQKLLIGFVFVFLSISYSSVQAKVLWLDDPKKKTIFEKTLNDMKKIYADSEVKTARTMRGVLDIYVDRQSLEYDQEKHKIYVDMFARVDRERNVPKSCKALISKAKRTLFGLKVKEKLMSYFSTVDEKDLRSFIKFRGRVDTYAVVGGDGSIKPVSPRVGLGDLPAGAKSVKSIMCTNNVLSDKVIFYKQ